jgi:hypothetical protein
MLRLLALWSINQYDLLQIVDGEFFIIADVKQELQGNAENEYK